MEALTSDQFLTLNTDSTGEFKDKGSRFVAYAFPVLSETDFADRLEGIKAEHFKARHHCYAYRIGQDGLSFRANDDGEPSGTAGRPILGQIDHFHLTDIGIVVVRYFGGTKLGVSGLIHAYKTAAAEAIQNGDIVQKTLTTSFLLQAEYEHMGHLLNEIKSMDIDIVEKSFEQNVRIEIAFPTSQATDMVRRFKARLLSVSEEYVDDDTVVDFCTIDKIEEHA